MSKENKDRISVYISKDLKNWLEGYADSQGDTVSGIIRDLIRDRKRELKMINMGEKYSEIWPILSDFLENISAQEFMEIDDMKDLVDRLNQYRKEHENVS